MIHTVLIGLDGATFKILDTLMDNGTMPFLRDFVNGGVKAELLSTASPLTPPAWISLMTGQVPGNHGVFDFIWAEERKSEMYFTLNNFRDIRSETIWSIASRYNHRSCSLNFPMMSPPPEILGLIVPGIVSWKHLRRSIYPPDLYDKLKKLPDFNAREFAWDFDMEKKAAKGVPAEEFENWINFHIRRERHWFEILKYIMKNEPCDLTAINFDGTDKILHIGWRFLHTESFPEKPSPWELKIRKLCLEYFRELDRFIAEISSMAGPEARIFFASDHGFGPTWEVFRVNTWLHSNGYLKWKDLDHLNEKDKESVERLIDMHFVYLDWENTTAYAQTTTSNGIYIRVANAPNRKGIPAEQYEMFRDELIRKLETVCDPDTGERIIKRILTKEEAYPGTNNSHAPDLTLVMRDHSFISILNKTPIVQHRPEIVGTHYPEGIFIAGGPGIKKGVSVPQLMIQDVAPCLLYSLGLDIPEDFDGQMPVEVFDPSYVSKNPVRIGVPTCPPDSYAFNERGNVAEPEEEKEIFDKLKALGYIE